jgi:hypothetical protein
MSKKSAIAENTLWGGPACAIELGVTPRKFYHLASTGALGDAVEKLGPRQYVGYRDKLHARFRLAPKPAAESIPAE